MEEVPLAFASSRASPYTLSRILECPSSSRRTTKVNAVVVIGVDRRGVGRDNSTRWRIVRIRRGCRRQASRRHPLTPSRSLDFHPSSTYHNCSKCSFLVSPHRPRPRRNWWPRSNQRSDLSVYSIYKETRSSDGSATHERHYAGWAADRDEAILRANRLYEGRDSIGAVLVIGNGPTEVEVVYRVDGEH